MRISGKNIVVLGGGTGLLGQPLAAALREGGATVHAPLRNEFDVLNENAVAEYLDAVAPDILFNAVAYTAVDKAEDEPDQAMALNRDLPAMLGRLCGERSILLVHFSTDFVFSGPHELPLTETDPTGPTSVYGSTKLAGEQALLSQDLDDLIIIRTAWLFGPDKINFVEKILGFAWERDAITVVHDQLGSPTYTPDLAEYTIALVEAGGRGLYHLANSGQASWCELAGEAVGATNIDCRVEPVPTSAYPTKAVRPTYSVLDSSKFTQTTGVTPRPWIQALHEYAHILVARYTPKRT